VSTATAESWAGGTRFARAVEVVKRYAARPDSISVLDRRGDVGLGQYHGFGQLVALSQAGGECRRESTPGAVEVQTLDGVAGESLKA